MKQVYSRVCVIFFLSLFLTLKISAQITLSISSFTDVLCHGGNNGTATATVSGGTGPFTYAWNPGGGTTATMTNFIAGSYTCTCTDQFDMSTATATVTITEPTQITATTFAFPSTCGNPNGQAGVIVNGGVAPYTYLWAPAGITTSTATGLTAGSYSCTITDANGCSINATATVTNQAGPTAIISSQQNATCQGGCNGSAIGTATGGTAPYTYSWSPSGGTSPTASGLCAGNYTLTVTDANGCVSWTSTTITQPSTGITFTLTPSPSQCSPCSGSILVSNVTNGTPPYSYNWTITSQTTNNPVNLCPATYTCTLSDANGCIGVNAATVTLNSNFATTVTPVNSGCTACTGTATANPTGGTGPYTYLWSPGGGTTQTITGLCAGTYSVVVTDATGCQVTANGVVGITTGFSATTSSTPANCWYNTGTGTVTVTGGVPPYTYLWTPTNQTTATATNLPPGVYHIIIGDQSGCFASVYDTIGSPGYMSSYITTTQMNCTSVNGMAVIHPNGGSPPYTYLWSNSTTNDTAFGLSGGNYSCVITDTHGCTNGASTTIYTACDNIVQGRVYSDPNMNCVFDNGDAGLWAYVYTVPGYYQATTNTQGFYNLHVPAPGTYTVYTNTYGYQVHCPVTGTYTVTFPNVGDTIFNRDFAENTVPIQDIAISMGSTPARPGFPMTYTLHYWNQGNVTVNNCVLTFTHPASLVYVSSTTIPTTYTAPTATWNLGTLTPNQNGTIIVTMNVPSNAVLGTSICANANIMPVAGDVYTYNNYATDCRVIQGSLDPNYKTTNCAGLDPLNGNINQDDSVLTYHIYFQNTGTDTAFNIVIEDTLSSFLNPISVVPGPSSDPYTFEQSNGLMKFNFYNILLPDSGRDEPNSHGWVSYQVKTKPGLPIGTVIDNTAYIYFDYNTAIITNTTSNLIATIGPSGIAENTSQEIVAYPNPFDESVQLILPENLSGKNCEITLTDVEGRIVLSQQNQNTNSITIQRGQLEAGIYFCTVRCEGALVGNKKLIIK